MLFLTIYDDYIIYIHREKYILMDKIILINFTNIYSNINKIEIN